MIEFYEYDGEADEYEYVGAVEDGEVVEGDLDWVVEFVAETDDLSFDEEEDVVQRVSNQYLVGVIPA